MEVDPSTITRQQPGLIFLYSKYWLKIWSNLYWKIRYILRCRFILSSGGRSLEGLGCSPIKRVRELGLIRRESVWSLSSGGTISKKRQTFQYERTNRLCFHSVPIVEIKYNKLLWLHQLYCRSSRSVVRKLKPNSRSLNLSLLNSLVNKILLYLMW